MDTASIMLRIHDFIALKGGGEVNADFLTAVREMVEDDRFTVHEMNGQLASIRKDGIVMSWSASVVVAWADGSGVDVTQLRYEFRPRYKRPRRIRFFPSIDTLKPLQNS